MGDRSIAAFLAALAARTPAPGGGAVAATTLATAAALARMVLAYTLGKPRYTEHAALHETIDRALGEATPELLRLADDDAHGYALLNAALRSGLRERDQEAFHVAVAAAVAPPRRALSLGLEIVNRITDLASTTNPHLESDRVIALRLALVGSEAALLNLRANLEHVDAATRADLESLMERALARLRQIPGL